MDIDAKGVGHKDHSILRESTPIIRIFGTDGKKGLQGDFLGGDLLLKGAVMLHKEHGGLGLPEQGGNLEPGVEIHEVEGLIPHVQMGGLTETGGQQNLLFLARREIFHLFFQTAPVQTPFFAESL